MDAKAIRKQAKHIVQNKSTIEY